MSDHAPMTAALPTKTQSRGALHAVVRRLWRRISGADARLANGLIAVLSSEMLHKANCFDYLCWLEETQQSENVKGADFLVMASDGTTCWGKTYADAVKVAMDHDKELYDAVRDLEANPPNAPGERPGATTQEDTNANWLSTVCEECFWALNAADEPQPRIEAKGSPQHPETK